MRNYITFTLTLFLIAVLAACEAGSTSQAVIPLEVSCTVFHRPSTNVAGQEVVVTLNSGTSQETLTVDEFVFQAHYQDDEFEGRSLQLTVNAADTDQQLTAQLYQMIHTQPPANEFVGGHGFTGLTYVYHPTSPAELQFFCQVPGK